MKKVQRSEDRISELPDEVLIGILSYLQTKESVRTSILSKRWRYLCSYVPVLVLDDSSLSHDDPNIDHTIHTSFINFLNHALNLRNADSLEKFSLLCSKFDAFRINEWIIAALRRGVEELELSIAVNEHFKLAAPLFVNEHLVLLMLENCVLNVPRTVHLPSLEKLDLYNVVFPCEHSCPTLLSGCPVLKKMVIDIQCQMQNWKILQITSPTLNYLTIEHHGSDHSFDFQVVVDAPNLEDLNIAGHMVKGYRFENLSSLSEAYIAVDLDRLDHSEVSGIRETVLQLVSGIANAKTITFKGGFMEALSFLDLSSMPTFVELTKLSLECNEYCGMLLPKLLDSSPVLRTLAIDEIRGFNGTLTLDDFVWHEPLQVPKCLIDSLKVVDIWGFRGQKNVLKFVKYLLSHATVLGQLSATASMIEHKHLKVSKELLAYL